MRETPSDWGWLDDPCEGCEETSCLRCGCLFIVGGFLGIATWVFVSTALGLG